MILEKGGMFGRFGTRLAWILVVLLIAGIIRVFSRYHSYLQTQSTDRREILFAQSSRRPTKWRSSPSKARSCTPTASPSGRSTRCATTTSVKASCIARRFARRHDHRQPLSVPSSAQAAKGKSADGSFPLVVSMGGLAASGGYYISMAVGNTPDTIFAEPTTWTGSIGVVIPHYDLSALLGKLEHRRRLDRQPPAEADGQPHAEAFGGSCRQGARHPRISWSQESFADFKDIVKSGRPALVADDPRSLSRPRPARSLPPSKPKTSDSWTSSALSKTRPIARSSWPDLDRDNVRVVKYLKRKGLLDDAIDPAGGEDQLVQPGRAFGPDYASSLLPMHLAPRRRGHAARQLTRPRLRLRHALQSRPRLAFVLHTSSFVLLYLCLIASSSPASRAVWASRWLPSSSIVATPSSAAALQQKPSKNSTAAGPRRSRFDVVDVSNDAAVATWAKDVLAGGAPDLLINNAAVMNTPAPLWQVPAAEFDRSGCGQH